MDVIFLILLVLGAFCFVAAAILGWGWRTANGAAPRFSGWGNLVAFGLFCWILVDLIKQARAM
jgi:hypothetical protein